jgi:hypothetical protein
LRCFPRRSTACSCIKPSTRRDDMPARGRASEPWRRTCSG